MRRALMVALLALLALPITAQAGTVAKIGAAWTFTGDAGNNFTRAGLDEGDPNFVIFVDPSAVESPNTGACSDWDSPDTSAPKDGIRCQMQAGDTVALNGGEGDDSLSARGSGFRFAFFGCFSFFIEDPCTDPVTRRVTMDGGPGRDTLTGGLAVPGAGEFSNSLNGGDGDDTVNGGPHRDTLNGGNGRDAVSGSTGADEIFGGPGIDEASFTYSGAPVTVTLDNVANDGAAGEGDNVHDDIEDIRGGSGSDNISGNASNNVLTGGPGDDTLTGNAGFDAFYGEDGADTISARDGNTERVDCGEGSDPAATIDTSDKRSGCETVAESNELEGDLDKDGFREPADCNDRDDAIKPGATDVPDNGVDENCDGADATNTDRDADGFNPPVDCDDNNAAFKPGAREIYGNAVDEDCNGIADPLQSIAAFVRGSFRDGSRATTIRRLQAASVQAGTLIRVICRGSGRAARRACRGKTKDVPVLRATSAVDLRRALNVRRIAPRVTFEIYFLREDSIAKLYAFTFRRNNPPTLRVRCQQVGNTRFVACP